MELRDLFKLLPWYWNCWMVLITIVILIPLTLYVALAYCNPFWFRNSMMYSCETLIDSAQKLRRKLMAPALKKYTLFDALKSGKNIF